MLLMYLLSSLEDALEIQVLQFVFPTSHPVMPVEAVILCKKSYLFLRIKYKKYMYSKFGGNKLKK